MPCFGCYWECLFENAPCLSLVDVEDVKKGLRIILKEKNPEKLLRGSKPIKPEISEYIEKAAQEYKSLKSQLIQELELSEADRAARLDLIHRLEADRAAKVKLINRLEADCNARLDLIHQLESALKTSEANCASRLDLIHQLESALKTSEADRAARLDLIHQLEAELTTSEADRAARLDLIHKLEGALTATETERIKTNESLTKLNKKMAGIENKLEQQHNELDSKKKELEEIYCSYSWRMTAPLRWLYGKGCFPKRKISDAGSLMSVSHVKQGAIRLQSTAGNVFYGLKISTYPKNGWCHVYRYSEEHLCRQRVFYIHRQYAFRYKKICRAIQ